MNTHPDTTAPTAQAHRRTLAIVLAVIVMACTACQSSPRVDDSLYAQLGGRAGISDITETMLLRIAGDARIADNFKRVDIDHLHHMLTDYLCVLADGPCSYTGDTLVNAHRGQHINSTEFNALVENLVLSMEDRNVPTGTQNRLLARLAPLRRAIVDAPAPMPPELEQLVLGDLL